MTSPATTGIVTKFQVQETTQTMGGSERIKLNALTPTAEHPENRIFAQATPWGDIALSIDQSDCKGVFEPGDVFQVIFQKVDA